MIGSFVQLMAAILLAPFASEEDKRQLAEEERLRRIRNEQFLAIERLLIPDAAGYERMFEELREDARKRRRELAGLKCLDSAGT